MRSEIVAYCEAKGTNNIKEQSFTKPSREARDTRRDDPMDVGGLGSKGGKGSKGSSWKGGGPGKGGRSG